jgi:hypothetical protein
MSATGAIYNSLCRATNAQKTPKSFLFVVQFAAAPACASDRSTFDAQGFAVYEGVCHLPVCCLDDSAERRARYTHLFCGLLLVQASEVGEP